MKTGTFIFAVRILNLRGKMEKVEKLFSDFSVLFWSASTAAHGNVDVTEKLSIK